MDYSNRRIILIGRFRVKHGMTTKDEAWDNPINAPTQKNSQTRITCRECISSGFCPIINLLDNGFWGEAPIDSDDIDSGNEVFYPLFTTTAL